MSYYRQTPHRTYGGAVGIPPLTPVVRAIIVACAAIWAAQFVLGPVLGVVELSTFLGIRPGLVAAGWVWQPLTYMWLHASDSPFHILINMLVLWMLGGDLERHWGSGTFLTYYLVCGVGAGALITVAGLLYNPLTVTVGASGAVYGLILAFGKIFAERVILFMMVFPMRARTFAWVMFAITFVSTLGHTGGGVSHVAHLGGMLAGYVYLMRSWRPAELFRELRWKLRRRRFKVMPPRDQDPWIH